MRKSTFSLIVIALAILALSSNTKAENPVVVLGTNYGNINVELFEAEAPITVANFLGYVNSGFYDGLIFHRVINGFMIQGGAYDLSLAVKPPGANIINESYNGLSNTRGTIAMARGDDSNSANSQFYINDVDNPGLDYVSPSDPRYCVFGEVLGQGDLDVVNAISEIPVSYYSQALQNLPDDPVVIVNAFQKKPDLVINDLGVSQITAYVNESVGVTVETENIGDFNTVPTDPNFDITLYLSDNSNIDWDTLDDGNEVGKYSLSSLAFDSNYSESIDFNAPGVPGTYYLRAKTDDLNSVAESNETNNWGPVITLKIISLDLIISDTNSMRIRYLPAEAVIVLVKVQNTGDGNAVPMGPSYFDVTLYLSSDPNADWDVLGDGNDVGRYPVVSLDAGTSYSDYIDFNAPNTIGIYYLRAIADDFNSVAESNETNNWGQVITLEVTPWPDFYVNGATGDDNWDGEWPTYQGGTKGPKATIQSGIDVAGDGNTVMIADGTYKGAGNRDLDFGGKAITVRSLNGPEGCIIDCNGTAEEYHRGFLFCSGEDTNSIVDGLTIKNGYANNGGGIYCEPNSTPTILNCVIRKCRANSYGGGIYDCNGTVSNCIVRDCLSGGDGGGLYGCDGQISNCNIVGNRADFDGAGLAGCNGTISDCNIVDNFGSGLYYCGGDIDDCNVSGNDGDGFDDCQATINNCVVKNNYGSGFYLCDETITNCTISGNDCGLDQCDGLIKDCTITGNIAFSRSGGGLNDCDGQIQGSIISGNYADMDGGGLYDCDGQISGCTIAGNDAIWGGGLYGCMAEVSNCIISDNTARYGGGMWYCNGTVINCTIVKNTATNNYAGGLTYCYANILNCIISNNSSPQILYCSEPNYSCVRNYTGGTGNIDADPCFADADSGDYHLKSQAGRWDPNTSQWETDAFTSACIDGGHPGMNWGQELWPHGIRINMGAYGGTTQASMSLSNTGIRADLNGDFYVNFDDFAIFAQKWFVTQPLLAADFDRDGGIDGNDLEILAEYWLIDPNEMPDPNFALMYDGFESGDFRQNPWQRSGAANWSITTGEANAGSYSAKSGAIAQYEESVLEITLELEYGTNSISFWFKTSCEAGYDYLKFYIDGDLQEQWTGNQDWQKKTYKDEITTPGPEHTFKWVYDKDYIAAGGSDCVWIDDVKVFYDPLP